ncbi:MAG TPA: penicillin-binding protein 2 [Candidatus Paceibacterota bacterium]
MRSNFAFRIRLIAVIVVAVALVLVARLYFVQVVHGEEYRQKAESQYAKQSTNQLDRGSIFFTAKDGSLISAATLASGYTVALNPTLIDDPEFTYTALKTLLPDIEHDPFIAKASKQGDTYEEIARKVSDNIGAKIKTLSMPGVELLRERWRFYPGNTLAAHAIGFLGYGADGTTIAGRYGLERFYDDALRRNAGGLYLNFFADLFTNIGSQIFSSDTPEGADVVTSIEPSVELYLENVLRDYDDAWHPKISGAIIMDPKTGAILAMAASPSFDLNDFKDADPNAFANPLVEGVYEFGSIVKPLTMAAGIDAMAVTPQTTYNDKGYAIYDGGRIANFDKKGRGVIPMQEVINQSLNTGAAFVVEKMGTEVFREYFEKFGVMEETGIDLPNEVAPLVENLKSPRTLEYATASFGQGIALTPVGMARALAALANHGVVPGPHVGVELRYGGGINKELGWSPERRAITAESADTITRMLVTAVDTWLLGGTAKIPEYSIAAKTGTAEIARADARGYYDDRYLHSFFGYFPAYDPKFFIFLFAVEPTGARYASDTWTHPFMKTVRFLITYYDIPPDRAPRAP